MIIRGLSYKIEKPELISLLENHGNITENDIYLEEFEGRKTGIAAVVFKTPELAKEARFNYNRKIITGKSYMDVSCEHNRFF